MSDFNRVIVRIDDIGQFDLGGDRIIRNLCKAGIRVTCAVVPTWLTASSVDFLTQVALDFPGHIEIHQHGYSHKNYGGNYEKYEFGINRSLKQQQRDIAKGYEILQVTFGDVFFPAFTPPFNAFDNSTLIALKTVGFRAISSFADHEPSCAFPEFLPDIDCFQWNPVREKTWKEIALEWYKGTSKALRGFILHPRFMSPESISLFSSNLPTLLAQSSTVTFAQLLSD